MKYVILGNGTAAVGCIEGIRVVDHSDEITVISTEPYPVYGRPLISYMLQGKTSEENALRYRPADFYEENGVKTMLGCTAVRIDSQKKVVVLTDGKEVPYDKLCIATGSRPFVPPMSGLETVVNQTSFMTLDDAKKLQSMLGNGKDKRVLIVGAGLIGLKCAEGILEKAKSVTVCDLAPRILPNVLTDVPSGIIQKHLEKYGVQFLLNDSVENFTSSTAKMKSGRNVDFDILVVAVGVRPNTELAAEAGCEVNRGILVDDHNRTTVSDIYSAGDCTVSHDISNGMDRILAILPNAYLQGETAGMNMAGGDRFFRKAVPMNASGFFGLHMVSAGSYDGEQDLETDGENYKLLVTKEDRLCGYILIGAVERAGIYTSLIREQTPLSSIDYELIREKPQLMAFSGTERTKKLGRAH